jgi:2-polyprenyl-6-methoxyphenol hydroxylase-like FAD-dependent oxidoreductase
MDIDQNNTPEANKVRVLISGASFAGLSTAYWMHRLGYAVTVVEVGAGLKMGGTPVNIEGDTIDMVRRMGLLERIQAQTLPVRAVQFVQADNTIAASMSGEHEEQGYEIERDDLLQMQFDAVKEKVEFLFGDSIARIDEYAEEVHVHFKSGREASYALVFGCDGTHSAVRRLCFGEESAYAVFLQMYFSLTIVPRLLIPENTTQMFNTPGKAVMLNGYHGKTDIGFCFRSDVEVPYDYRDTARQKRMIAEQFADEGWRTQGLLDEVQRSDDFYFDKLCQIRMPTWTKGRIALVGDAAYNPSPAAGMGGSLAIVGATALADAFAKHPSDYAAAFAEYERSLRPVVEQVQRAAVNDGLAMFAPATAEAIRERNARIIAQSQAG